MPTATLDALRALDADRAKAIVKAVDSVVGKRDEETQGVEVVEIEKGVGYVLVHAAESLRRIPGLRLIEVAPCRYLLSIPTGTPPESVEVAILDQLDHLPENEIHERALLTKLRELLKDHRLRSSVSKAEILFVKTRV